ncbi:9014_t:CDS:2, partial [Cetraspora pellucida]
MPAISITHNGISKRRPYETLSIPSTTFEQALNLYIGLQFDYLEHDRKLDKNEGVYKYIFECQHAGSPQAKKKAIEPSQQHNQNSSGPLITKLNLIYYGHTPCSNNAYFINTYQQLPQNIIDK